MLYNANRPPSVGGLFRLLGRLLSGLRRRRVGKQKKELVDYKLYVADHYASQEFLNELKREITESLRELGRRIDHVFHPNRD